MKKTISIIFIVILSTLLFALLMKICLIVGIGISLGSSEETFLMSSKSPTGEYNLEAYKIEAGATVDFSIKVYKISGNHYQTMDISVKAQRKKVIDDLKVKLLSPQPPVKKAAQKRVYKCQWKLGDVFAYQLESELAKKRGLYGRYFLIRKVDEGVWYPGHIVPIVYVKITDVANLPSNIEEYNQLEYVQTYFTKYEERFWPIDMRCPQEDIAQKSKINYQVDEYGFLPQYRIMLLNISKRTIPSKLVYVGNFMHAVRPKNEFVPHSKINISSVFWKKFDETFETKMIKLYCGHNLREFSIYKEKISGF